MPVEFPEQKAGSKETANIWVAASDGDMERVIEVCFAALGVFFQIKLFCSDRG